MSRDPLITGYARALFEMAQAEQVLPRLQQEMFQLQHLLNNQLDLLQFLKDPNLRREGKRRALEQLFEGRAHPLLLNALIAISDQDRAGRLPHIAAEFLGLAAAARQKVSGELISAVPLDEQIVQRLTDELKRITGCNVELFQRVDPAILGGAIVKVGEQVIDGSLRRKLNQLREQLSR
jgi:F-type H+-transporting ATPase subunit delta